MASVFLATAFLIGFAWEMVVNAAVFALLSYFIARMCWRDREAKLAGGIAWGVWFAVLAYYLLPIAYVKALSMSGTHLLAVAVGGGIVLALGGLYILMVRTGRRSLRAMAFVTAILVIGLVCFSPFGVRREAVAASPDEATYKMAASLYAAAQRGDVVELGNLVSRGADVNAQFLGLTPLYGAVIERQLDAAVFLLDFSADVNSANGPARRSPLHQAVRNGDIPMIELLLRRGASVTATTTFGRTPLDYAIAPPAPLTKPENSEEIAAMLRAAGAK